MAPVDYLPEAKAPAWVKFLLQIMNQNQNLVDFIQRAIGYSLTGLVDEQCWFICHGVGANGKGTLLNTFLSILGGYGTQAAPDLLMLARASGEKHPTEQADLMGRRFAVAQETEEGRRLAEVAVKQMTGGDKIKARFMRGDFFQFDPAFKLWLATNHKPVIKDTTESTWRRIKMIPFEVVIPEHERDQKLSEKLKDESSGILAWAVRGCLEWQKNGLQTPAEVRAATEEYREASDVIGEFLKDRTLKTVAGSESLQLLFNNYTAWAIENGVTAVSLRRFSEALQEKGFSKCRQKSGRQVLGLCLRPL